MAETSTEPIEIQDVSQQQEVVEQPKRGRGRPRTKSNSVSDTEPDQEPFFIRLRSDYSPEDWQEAIQLYLFRCQPYYDRKATGQHANLRKYFQPVEPEEIKHEFGSGQYKLMLVALDRGTGKYHKVEEHFFTIMDLNYPPQLPVGPWLEDKRNADWAWAKPLLEAEQRKKAAENHGGTVMQGMDQATQMFQAAVAAVKTLRPDQSPEEQHSLAGQVIASMEKSADRMLAMANPAQFMGMVDKVIAAVSPRSDGGSDLVKVLMAQNEAAERRATEERAANRELLTKLLDRPAPPAPPSLSEQLSVLGGLKESLRGLFGRGDGGSNRATDWLDVVKEIAPDVLKTVDHGIQGFMISKGVKPQPRQPTVNVNPQLPQGNASQPAANAKEPTQEEAQVAMMENINQRFGWVIDQVAPELSNIFVDGEPGMAFRELILEQFGSFAYNQVRKFSVETIMTLIEIRKAQGDPTVQVRLQALQPPDKVAQFIQEFLSDEPYDPEDDETPDEAATGSSAKTDF